MLTSETEFVNLSGRQRSASGPARRAGNGAEPRSADEKQQQSVREHRKVFPCRLHQRRPMSSPINSPNPAAIATAFTGLSPTCSRTTSAAS